MHGLETEREFISATSWVGRSAAAPVVFFGRYPRSPRSLRLFAPTKESSVAAEYERCVALCRAQAPLVTSFVQMKGDVDRLLLHGDWESALRSLRDIEVRFGQSFWLIRTTLATLIHFASPSLRDEYTEAIRAAVKRRGPVALLLYHLLPLGNRAVNTWEHSAGIDTHFVRIGVPASIRPFLKWIINGHLDEDVSTLELFLASLSRCTIPDLVDGVVAGLLTLRRFRPQLADEIRELAEAPRLTRMEDRHAEYLAEIYDRVATHSSPPATTKELTASYWLEIDGPARLAALGLQPTPLTNAPKSVLTRGVVAALEGDIESQPFLEGMRVAAVFSHQDWGVRYIQAVEEESLTLAADYREPVTPLCYAEPEFIPVHPPPYLVVHEGARRLANGPIPQTASVYAARIADGLALPPVTEGPGVLAPEELSLARALGELRNGRWSDAIVASSDLVQSTFRYYRRRGLQIQTRALIHARDYPAAAKMMCEYMVANPRSWFDLPVYDILRAISNDPQGAASIRARDRVVLYSLPQAVTVPDYRDEQMNAFDDLLLEVGALLPSEIPKEVRSNPWCRHFMAHACTVDTIERSLRLRSKSEVLQERIKLCNFLRSEFNEPEATEYLLESIELTRLLTFARNVEDLEQVKLSLDVARLQERISASVSADFSRYIEGKERGERPIELTTTLSRNPPGVRSWENVDLLGDPAWQVFASLVGKARRVYLTDPTYGLDASLSMRIRHGAVEGLIRGEYRQSRLLTTRGGTGDYVPHADWGQLYATDVHGRIDPERQAIVQDTLTVLTRQIDHLVDRLCGDLLHIADETHPDGLIDPRIPEEHLREFERSALPDLDLQSFCHVFLQLMHSSVVVSLQRVQQRVFQITSEALRRAFSDALGRAKKSRTSDGSDIALTAALTSAHTQASHVARRLAEWFKEPAILNFQPFALGECVEIALHMVRERAPIKCASSIENCVLHGGLYVPMVDILLNLLQNVIDHSGLDEPACEMVITLSNDVILFRVMNDRDPPVTQADEDELAELRATIASHRAEARTKLEGKSGLAKIANYLNRQPQLEGSEIAFRYERANPNDRFVVEMAIRLADSRLRVGLEQQ